ncbi:hypothetical protein, partial [Streptomyces sp. NPDC055055]
MPKNPLLGENFSVANYVKSNCPLAEIVVRVSRFCFFKGWEQVGNFRTRGWAAALSAVMAVGLLPTTSFALTAQDPGVSASLPGLKQPKPVPVEA